MELICAAFRDQRNLRTRSVSLVGVVVRRGDAKFLDGIERRGQYGGERVSARLVIHVHTVERNVALIAAGAVHGSISRVLVLVDVRAVPGVGDTRLQAEEVGHVAAFQRDLPDLIFVEGVSNRGVDEVQGGRFAADADVLGHRADFQLDVRRRRGIHEQLQPRLHVVRKSARRYGQGVSAGRYGENAKVALRSGRYGALKSGLRVGEHHGGVWDRAPAWVRDRALQ